MNRVHEFAPAADAFWEGLNADIARARTPDELMVLRQSVLKKMDSDPDQAREIAMTAAPLIGMTEGELMNLYNEREDA